MARAVAGPVEAGELAGAALLAWRRGVGIRAAAVGRRDLETGAPVQRDTIFRIASLTKPVTTLAALTLLDEGRFGLEEPVTTCAPELAHMRVIRAPDGPLDDTDAAAREITFGDLLTHRAGLTYGEFHRGPIRSAFAERLGGTMDNELTPDEWIARLATLPLIDQPGAGFHYGASTDLLGFLIARLEGTSLGALLERRVFAPLGLRDTGFLVPAEKRHRRAGLCGFDGEGRLTTLSSVPGGHAWAERPSSMTFESGGQGLWSTVDDYLAIARELLGDASNGASILRAETRAMMTSNQLTPAQRAEARMFGRPIFAEGHGYGMGVAVVMEPEKADPMRCRGCVGTFGWPGAYGGWWQADPTDGSVLIFMAHSMAELSQLARGVGLGVWSAIGSFHSVATSGSLERGAPRAVLGGRLAFVAVRGFCRDPYRADAVFTFTAARMSFLNAVSSISSPSRKSIARRVLPSRLELNRPDGSSTEAPLANVNFTALLYDSPVQMIPSCDHTGTFHFHSSTTAGSACLMRVRSRASVSPLHPSSSVILASILLVGESPLVGVLFMSPASPSWDVAPVRTNGKKERARA
jgi:CubicO group peptidase (beta-lactamase class C family)